MSEASGQPLDKGSAFLLVLQKTKESMKGKASTARQMIPAFQDASL